MRIRRLIHFARRYLEECGINQRNIHPKICPSAKESCFDFVMKEYEKEVETYREKKNHLNLALVVIMDGDGQSDQRLKKLENPVKREKDEKIIFIPNQNIETWFEYVANPDEDCKETLDYKQNHKETAPTIIAKDFKTKVCQRGKPPLLPSLKAACNELRRLGL